LHLPILKDALATDLPILCEKPLGLTEAECREIEDQAAGRPAPVWVAMEYRYMPPIARLIEEVRAGTAGRLAMVSIREHRFPFLEKVGSWNRFNATSGGTLVEKCCHFFDLMRLILEDEPRRVFATGGRATNHLEERYPAGVPDIIDHAYVSVEFAGGARAMLDLCMFAEGAEWQEEVTVVGPDARIDARMPGPTRFEPNGQVRHGQLMIAERATRHRRVEHIETPSEILAAGDHHGSTFYQHERFVRLVREGGAPEVGLRDGRIAVAVGAAAEESVATGRVVTLGGSDA
ncbi:MAG: Gfo/Idh/MocA family oxidoreductase, partial [Pseudomonadota bacterium]